MARFTKFEFDNQAGVGAVVELEIPIGQRVATYNVPARTREQLQADFAAASSLALRVTDTGHGGSVVSREEIRVNATPSGGNIVALIATFSVSNLHGEFHTSF